MISFFLFGMRSDKKKKIPATFMKLQLRAALEALDIEEDAQGNVKKLVKKKVRDSIKDKLKRRTLENTLPAVKLTELLWNLKLTNLVDNNLSSNNKLNLKKYFLKRLHSQLFL